MPKRIRTDILTAQDPFAARATTPPPADPDTSANAAAATIAAAVAQHAAGPASGKARPKRSATPQGSPEPAAPPPAARRDPAAPPPAAKSSILVDFAKEDYQLLKEAAHRHGLNLRAYIRKASLERAEAETDKQA